MFRYGWEKQELVIWAVRNGLVDDIVVGDPMATAAAIDRVVHHSVILEFDVPSYRTSEAQGRQQNATDNYQQEEKRQK